VSRLYVSLKLKDGTRILTYGDSNAVSMNEYFDRLFDLIQNKKSTPTMEHEWQDYQGAELKLCSRRKKHVRRLKIINFKEECAMIDFPKASELKTTQVYIDNKALIVELNKLKSDILKKDSENTNWLRFEGFISVGAKKYLEEREYSVEEDYCYGTNYVDIKWNQ